MAQRPGFDMNRLSTATKVLLVAGILLIIDSFLPWQHACGEGFGDIPGFCFNFGAMSGNGGFLGVLMFILALALVVWEVLPLANVNLNMNVPHARISAALAAGTVLFGLIKFLLAVTNSPGIGAWIGLILLLAIAYGAYMKFQEPATTTASPTTPPPPPAGGGGFSS